MCRPDSRSQQDLQGNTLDGLFDNITAVIQARANPHKPACRSTSNYLQLLDTTCDADRFWVGVWPAY